MNTSTYKTPEASRTERQHPVSQPVSSVRPPVAILIADDDPINREVVAAMLDAEDCTIETSEDGPSTIAATRRTRFDILLLDGQMPGCSGPDVARTVRADEAARQVDEASRLPIVALTALAAEGDRLRCLEAGMDDYLSKPFDRDQLLAALRRVLPGRFGTMQAVSAPERPVERLIVDPEAIRRIMSVEVPGSGLLKNMIALYASEARRLVGELETMLASGDHRAASMTAHRLKSASASLGAQRVAAACQHVEDEPETAALDPAGTAGHLSKDIAAACGVLDAMVHQHGKEEQ